MADRETLRGTVSNLRYIEQTGREMRYTDKPDDALTVTFEVGGRHVAALNRGFPAICEGDDVEVVGVVNPRSGGMEVVELRDQTTGTTWKFSPWGWRR